MPPAAIKPAGVSEVDFDGLLSPPLKLQEDLKNGCGGQLWPAGMILSKYMLRKHKDDIEGKDMYLRSLILFTNILLTGHSVELGAGGGLVG